MPGSGCAPSLGFGLLRFGAADLTWGLGLGGRLLLGVGRGACAQHCELGGSGAFGLVLGAGIIAFCQPGLAVVWGGLGLLAW